MTTPDAQEMKAFERRKYPRYYVFSRLMLAIEDETLKESIGIGEPGALVWEACELEISPLVRMLKSETDSDYFSSMLMIRYL